MTDQKRNYGIDLLRIVSMIMVVTLHVLGNGWFLDDIDGITPVFGTMWLLEIACYCAVNCYALISGYVGYGKKFKLSGIIQLWIEVVFYLVLFNLIYKMIDPSSVDDTQMFTSLFPVMSDKYWYFTSYFVLFLFTPFINSLVDKMDFKKHSLMILLFVIVFSLMLMLSTMKKYDFGNVNDPITSGYSMFGLNSGYSPLWLMIMYYTGAYIKKYRLAEKIRPRYCVAVYVVCVLLSLVLKLITTYLYDHTGHYGTMISFIVKYYTPTILLCSLALFVLFAKMKCGQKTAKVISFFSSSAFGVYIIHLHRNNLQLLRNHLSGFEQTGVIRSLLYIVATVLIIWFVCSMIDKIRQVLFRLLKIRVLSEKADAFIRKIVSHTMSRYQRIMSQTE